MSAVEPDPILEEIRQTREQIARECDFDVHKLMARIRAREEELKAQGVKFVSFAKKTETK